MGVAARQTDDFHLLLLVCYRNRPSKRQFAIKRHPLPPLALGRNHPLDIHERHARRGRRRLSALPLPRKQSKISAICDIERLFVGVNACGTYAYGRFVSDVFLVSTTSYNLSFASSATFNNDVVFLDVCFDSVLAAIGAFQRHSKFASRDDAANLLAKRCFV